MRRFVHAANDWMGMLPSAAGLVLLALINLQISWWPRFLAGAVLVYVVVRTLEGPSAREARQLQEREATIFLSEPFIEVGPKGAPITREQVSRLSERFDRARRQAKREGPGSSYWWFLYRGWELVIATLLAVLA